MAGNARVDLMAHVSALERRYGLPDHGTAQLVSLLQLLLSDPLAPTAVRDPLKAVNEHLADALIALELQSIRAASSFADLGAGAGIPGLPLAIALPRACVWLVESSARKCAFLQRSLQTCGVANAFVVHSRAESWRAGLRRFDVVTARALAPLAVVEEYAAPLLRIGGHLVVWGGRRDPDAEWSAARAALELGLELDEPKRVWPYEGAEHRHLHLALKVSETPAAFPRREGLARKRPLGGRGAPATSRDRGSDRTRR
jgi:16S rRNA (guanine527-N7)-methyltransferase